MKRVGKPVFFVVAILVVVFLVLSLTGISTTYGDRTDVYIKGGNDIRWGIDIPSPMKRKTYFTGLSCSAPNETAAAASTDNNNDIFFTV